MIDVLLGLQWGDEGKGKVVDYFAPQYDVVARFQGGPNAGHTLHVNGTKLVLHQVPSGILHPRINNLIGSGVVLDAITLQKECSTLNAMGIGVYDNLLVSERANLIVPTHRLLDKASELAKGKEKIGSTLKGIGPAYMDMTGRNALRVGNIMQADFDAEYRKLRTKHLRLLSTYGFEEDFADQEAEFFAAVEFLRGLKIVNGEYWMNEQLLQNRPVLAEGAQGSMLDVTFGTFPFVTSSHTLAGGVCTGLGIAPKYIREVIGVSKAYCTRVGSGPFPTELEDETGERLRQIGSEFGATTGRPRRCGWIDLVALNYACMVNGVTQLVITKFDVLDTFEELQVCTAYQINDQLTTQLPFDLSKTDIKPQYQTFKGWQTETANFRHKAQLPQAIHRYTAFLEKELHTPIRFISNGPAREQIVQV
jgi:adenylosuccinate synthase